MAKVCEICGKRPMVGNNVSKSKNRNKKRFMPNLQKINVMYKGTKRKMTVCTRCIKAGKVRKAVR